MSKTPPVVMVISILGIIYGGFTLIGVPCSMLVLFGGFLPPDPVMDSLRTDSIYIAITIVSVIISALLGTLLLASSIGSLKLKNWGRLGMITYAICHVITTLVGTIISFAYVIPKTAAAMPAGPGGPVAAKAGMIGGIIGGVFGMIFQFAIAGVILYFMTRPKVVDAFHGILPASGSFPVDSPGQPQDSTFPTAPGA